MSIKFKFNQEIINQQLNRQGWKFDQRDVYSINDNSILDLIRDLEKIQTRVVLEETSDGFIVSEKSRYEMMIKAMSNPPPSSSCCK